MTPHTLMAQVLSPFIVIHGHTHGAFSLTRPLPFSFTFPSCPSPSTLPRAVPRARQPIVMASLHYSAADDSEDTLTSFTSHSIRRCTLRCQWEQFRPLQTWIGFSRTGTNIFNSASRGRRDSQAAWHAASTRKWQRLFVVVFT